MLYYEEEEEGILLINEDCLVAMKDMPDNFIDAIVTDPPAGISFMGKTWDTFDKLMFGKKGEEGENDLKVKKNFEILPRYSNADLMGFQNFICTAFTEAIRILKPGGHALVWAIPRTSHHTAMGLERAGFEVRDCLYHIFGSGFPKNLDLGKALDKLQGNKREVVGRNPNSRENCDKTNTIYESGTVGKTDFITKGISELEGYGTSLKPAVECWWLVRKPISEKTIVENCLRWGVGGINIDGCRVGKQEGDREEYGRGHDLPHANTTNSLGKFNKVAAYEPDPQGRFPANLILECICDEVITESTEVKEPEEVSGGIFSPSTGKPAGRTYKGGRQIHTNPECPCYMLDQQSGDRKGWASQKHNKFNPYGGNSLNKSKSEREGYYEGFNDSGGASRFFLSS